jgi:hypothetical protein
MQAYICKKKKKEVYQEIKNFNYLIFHRNNRFVICSQLFVPDNQKAYNCKTCVYGVFKQILKYKEEQN